MNYFDHEKFAVYQRAIEEVVLHTVFQTYTGLCVSDSDKCNRHAIEIIGEFTQLASSDTANVTQLTLN